MLGSTSTLRSPNPTSPVGHPTPSQRSVADLLTPASGIVAGGKLEGTPFKLGDEVLGITPAETVAKTGNGALAEYTLVEPNALVKKPSNISYVEAASFPLAGLTAWWALVNTAQVKQGSRVLINGATGAVGAWGTQIAKAKGAYVVVTCSGESESLAKKLGADEVIDYKSVNLVQHLKEHYSIKDGKGFDAIFDPVGQQHVFAASASYLKPDGVYLDLFGGVHLDSISAVISTATGLFNSALRPRFLGGVPRTFKMLMLPAHKMVSLFSFACTDADEMQRARNSKRRPRCSRRASSRRRSTQRTPLRTRSRRTTDR